MFESVYKALSAIGYMHPIHPAMTNLPVGMVMGALVFALVGLASRRNEIRVTAYHCIILAMISVFPTMLLGYMDWHHYYGGAWLLPIIDGAQTGPVIIPGKPDESKLVRRIKGIDQPRMPFAKPPLSESEIGLIVRWVQQGAPENIR